MHDDSRRWLGWGLRLALSIGLVGLAARQANFSWQDLATEVTGWRALSVAVLLAAAQIVMLGLRWWLLLPKGNIGPGKAVVQTLRAYGINHLIPVAVAGEVWRYHVGTQSAYPGRTIAGSLMLDRASNVASWGTTLALVLLLSPWPQPAPTWVGWGVVGVSALVFISLERGAAGLSKTTSMGQRFAAVFLSVFAQGVLWLQLVACFWALGLRPQPLPLLLGFPWLLAVKALPLAYAGWGFREVAVLQIYKELGCEPHQLFTASVLLGATSMAVSLFGLIPGHFLPAMSAQDPGAFPRSDL